MKKTMMGAAIWSVSLLLMASAAAGQEPKPSPEPESPEPQVEETKPRPQIRVLQHPHDLASFYRSSQGGHGAFGVYGYGPSALDTGERYPLARYYRLGPPSPNGYSRFWTSGYGYVGGSRLGRGYRRTIGENGDLFLMCPTFLAPVGPLTGFFLDGR
jgi:hypothetical protein